METKTQIDIEKMSKETSIPVFKIRKALGMPAEEVCTAKTAQEAKDMRDKATPIWPAIITQAWCELSLKEALAASSFEEAVRVFDLAPKGSQANVEARKKMIEFATTIEQVDSMLIGFHSASEELELMQNKLISLLLQEIEKTEDVNRLERIYKSYGFLKVKIPARKKWIQCCKTIKELKVANFLGGNEYESNAYEFRILIAKRWLELAVTQSDVWIATHNMAPDDSDVQIEGIKKLATFF